MWEYCSFNLISSVPVTRKLRSDMLAGQTSSQNNQVGLYSSIKHIYCLWSQSTKVRAGWIYCSHTFYCRVEQYPIVLAGVGHLTSSECCQKLYVTAPFKTRQAALYGTKIRHLLSYSKSMLDHEKTSCCTFKTWTSIIPKYMPAAVICYQFVQLR